MGKKPKNSVKTTTKTVKTQTIDPPSLKISELCLEEFEKSLASVLESLSSKKIEVLRTYAYNSKNDPTTVIGKISAKYRLDDEESVQSLQETILTAANINPCVNAKLITVKSTTSSDRTNSSQDDNPKRTQQNVQKVYPLIQNKLSPPQDRERMFKPRRMTHSGPQQIERYHNKQSTTPPQRGMMGLSELKKCLSDGKKRDSDYELDEEQEEEEEFERGKRGSEGLSKSFSHFKSYRELIEMKPNIYIKANKHFLIDELSLEDILQRIYFEGYSYDELKEYIFSALREISSFDEFVTILRSSIEAYSQRVRELIMEKLDEVIVKTKRLVQRNNGYPEIVHEFERYKKFSKHCTTYTGIINQIYDAYKSLEMITTQIEKVYTLYINGFCKERARINCGDLHKSVFAEYFFNDPLIKDFLEMISRYFEERHFYASKYPTAVSQILEICDCLNRIQQYESNSQQESFDRGYDKQAEIEDDDDDDICREMDNEKVRVSLTVHEEVFKKMQGYETYKGAEKIPSSSNTTTTNNNNKSKKKKNKKKKNKGEAEVNKEIEPTPELTSSSSKPMENKEEKENLLSNREKKKDLFRGSLKQNTGNLKLDTEVEEFERRLDLETDSENRQEKIKPNISSEWVQSLRQRLHKMKML